MKTDNKKTFVKSIPLIISIGLAIIFLSDLLYGDLICEPLSYFFGNIFYWSFYIEFFRWGFLLLFLIVGLFSYKLNFTNEEQSTKKKNTPIYILISIFSLAFFFFICKPYFLDLEYVVNGKYLTIETDLDKARSEKRSKGKRSYYLDVRNLDLSDYKVESDDRLNINVYQYKEIEKLYNAHNLESRKIKVYYLPYSKTLLRYELLD